MYFIVPILSVENFLHDIIKKNTDPHLRNVINDKYFIVHSLDEIVSDYNKGTLNGENDNNKSFYKKRIIKYRY